LDDKPSDKHTWEGTVKVDSFQLQFPSALQSISLLLDVLKS